MNERFAETLGKKLKSQFHCPRDLSNERTTYQFFTYVNIRTTIYKLGPQCNNCLQYKRNLTIGRYAIEWGSQLLGALRSCVMDVCENKISKTGNQNKNCAGVKSVTAYCSMGAEVFFRR